MVHLDDTTAKMLLNIYNDIMNLDARMTCSDAGFRRHFMLLVKTPPAQDAVAQLRKAVRDAENNPDD